MASSLWMSPLALSLRFLQTQPDGKLVELACAGHTPAFEALVRRYRKPLLRYCRRIVASDAAAEDVLQQALLQAWSALQHASEVANARAWLYRIVHNAAVSSLRQVADSVELDEAAGAAAAEDRFEQRMAVREV